MNPNQYSDCLVSLNNWEYIRCDDFVFRVPNILDVQIFKNVPEDCQLFTQCYIVFNQCCVTGQDFKTLKRDELKKIIEVCLFLFSFRTIEVEACYKNIYKINGGSFNNLHQYEMMPLWKIQKLIKAHNEVQEEIKQSMRGD